MAGTRRTDGHPVRRIVGVVVRALREFLLLPTVIIAAFIVLAILMVILDHDAGGWLAPVERFMRSRIFVSSQSTSSFLTTVAGSVITVTSITFSLLLLAVQQSATSLTTQVFDQFMGRPINQVYLGFFVGLALYALLILATVTPGFNPALSAALGLLLVVAGLYLLAILMYSTVNQMHPSQIIAAVHDHALRARIQQHDLLARTVRSPRFVVTQPIEVQIDGVGFVVDIALAGLGAAIGKCKGRIEVEYCVNIGGFVARGDTVACIHAERPDEGRALVGIVQNSLRLERRRSLRMDPEFAIQQLVTICWASGSTAKQDLTPVYHAVHMLRDLLAAWSADHVDQADTPLPVVYRDGVMNSLLEAFEAIAVISAESHQFQEAAAVAGAFARMLPRVSPDTQADMRDITVRVLPFLCRHALTRELESALRDLAAALRRQGFDATSERVDAALAEMREPSPA